MREYDSKPLECWTKLKELRRKLVKDTWQSKEKGQILVLGGMGFGCLVAGLGECQMISPMPTGRDWKDPNLITDLADYTQTKGYGRELCATLRVGLGMLFKDTYGLTPSGEILMPDFHLDGLGCQGQIKAVSLYSHYYNIPSFYIEFPLGPDQSDYLVSQLNDSIEWMEKVTGKKYDDELLIEGVYNEWRTRVLFGRIIEFQKAIPAPLTQKNLASFAVLIWRSAGHRRDVGDFFQIALDEVRERAGTQIAALSTERFRLIHEGPNTWYPSSVFKYPQKYGAIYIGSWLYFTEFGAFSVREDGSIYVPQTPEERGIRLRTREDALQSLAEMFLECNQRFVVEERVEQRLNLVEDWKIDGVVFALDRGCPGNTCTSMETVLAMKKKGIRVLVYDTACANPGEFSEAEYHSRIDAFLESLGLNILEGEKGTSS